MIDLGTNNPLTFAEPIGPPRLDMPVRTLEDQRALVKSAASEMVSTAFLKPVFESMRQDPFRADIFGTAQRDGPFAQMLDDLMAREIGTRAASTIVDSVASSLLESLQLNARADVASVGQGESKGSQE